MRYGYGIWACYLYSKKAGIMTGQQVCFIYESMPPPSCHNPDPGWFPSGRLSSLAPALMFIISQHPTTFISHLIISQPILRPLPPRQLLCRDVFEGADFVDGLANAIFISIRLRF